MIEVVGLKGAAHLGMIKAKQTLLSGGPIQLAQGREVPSPSHPLVSFIEMKLNIKLYCFILLLVIINDLLLFLIILGQV